MPAESGSGRGSVVIGPQWQRQIALRAVGPACLERSLGDDLGCDVWPQDGPAVFQVAAPVVPVVSRVHTDAPGVPILVADRDVRRSAWLGFRLAVDQFMRDAARGQLDAEHVKELSHCHYVVSLSWHAARSLSRGSSSPRESRAARRFITPG